MSEDEIIDADGIPSESNTTFLKKMQDGTDKTSIKEVICNSYSYFHNFLMSN